MIGYHPKITDAGFVFVDITDPKTILLVRENGSALRAKLNRPVRPPIAAGLVLSLVEEAKGAGKATWVESPEYFLHLDRTETGYRPRVAGRRKFIQLMSEAGLRVGPTTVSFEDFPAFRKAAYQAGIVLV